MTPRALKTMIALRRVQDAPTQIVLSTKKDPLLGVYDVRNSTVEVSN
jgi:hypothetical protein